MMAASIRRRRKRRRVSTTGLTSGPPSASASLRVRPRIARCTIATSTNAASSVSPAVIERSVEDSAATMSAAMAREGIRGAVLLDALGTLVELERPWPHLVDELAARGVVVGEGNARAAMLAEMAYYRAHHDEGSSWPALRDLRRRCAAVVQESLGTPLPLADVEEALLAAIRFRPYPEVPGVLALLRSQGARLAVVSNWDISLHDVLERTALRPLVDAVVISAELGAAKPDPAIFHAALERLGAAAGDAVHVGDSLEHDVAGARAAGVEAILMARDHAPVPAGVRVVSSLDELLDG
jgi:putative hydrolase of the HAD superfamily